MKKTYITPSIIFSKIENIGKSNLAGLDTKQSFNELKELFMNMALKMNNSEKIDSLAAHMDVERQVYMNNYALGLQTTNTYTK